MHIDMRYRMPTPEAPSPAHHARAQARTDHPGAIGRAGGETPDVNHKRPAHGDTGCPGPFGKARPEWA